MGKTKHKRITQEEARELFAQGYPVGASMESLFRDPIWRSAADGENVEFDWIKPYSSGEGWVELDDPRVTFWRRGGLPTVAWDVPGMIFRREEFRVHSISASYALRGDAGSPGDLPEAWAGVLAQHASFAESLYIVRSFHTPIAWQWKAPALGGEGIVIPPVRYSLTTTQHQYIAAAALGARMPEIEERSEAHLKRPRSPYGPGGISHAMSTR